eukprot:jgi/Ulvmu1/8031/UM004_0268.1
MQRVDKTSSHRWQTQSNASRTRVPVSNARIVQRRYSRAAHGRLLENSECTRASSLPQVDWSRFHLQILFVDTDDFSNARFAHALFENIASWNGHGLSLYGWTCGTQATEYAPERAVSLMIRAAGLKTSPKLFTREPEQLDLRDMYIYDMIVCMNEDVKQQVLQHFEPDLRSDWDCQEDRDFYKQRICKLHEFLNYVPDDKLRQKGGSALLPTQLSHMVGEDIASLKTVQDIPTAELGAVGDWNNMLKCIVVGVAGVTQYLMDSYPEDLDQAWLR